MKFASVDIGSNTTLLLVVESEEDGFAVLEDEIYFTRLAEGLQQTNQISQNALIRLEKAFQSIKQKLDSLNVDHISIVATSASRQAKNQNEIFNLAKKFQFNDLKIISPDEEASLTYVGAFFGLGHEVSNPLVIDIGGGSTELVNSEKSYSLNMGSVSLTEKFLTPNPLSRIERINLSQFIKKQFEPLDSFFQTEYTTLIFVAGTPITLAFLEKNTSDPNEVHGLVLTKNILNFWLDKLSKLSVEERKSVPHMSEHRSDVIISGLFLLREVLDQTQKTEFIVSATGVRYGLILEQLNKS